MCNRMCHLQIPVKGEKISTALTTTRVLVLIAQVEAGGVADGPDCPGAQQPLPYNY